MANLESESPKRVRHNRTGRTGTVIRSTENFLAVELDDDQVLPFEDSSPIIWQRENVTEI